jgi:hypothetical protein
MSSTMKLKTATTELLQIDHPALCAPMVIDAADRLIGAVDRHIGV